MKPATTPGYESDASRGITRALPERRTAADPTSRTYRFEFRDAQGRSCCKNDDITRLCDSCKAKAAPRVAANADTDAEWRAAMADLLGENTPMPDAPDPYAAATPVAPKPQDDPLYQPYGTPADPYAAALNARKENR